MNVLAGGPYSVEDTIQIAPGTYWIWEDPSSVPAGYSVVAPNPQKIIAKANTKFTVTFTNQKNADELASLIFEKKVAGKNIVEWLTDSGYTNVSEILAGLEFYLDGPNGNYGPVTPGPDGKVVFTNLNPGTYTLSEEVVGAAAGIFTKMADISDITVAAGEQPSFTVLGGTVKKVIEGADIEDSDLFTLINGWGQFDWGYGPEGIGYPGLNSTGHIFYIGIRNTRTDEVLHSYCANAGSTNFAEGYGQYKIANSLHEIQWQQAFNYINDTYGDLNENRVITQIVTWALLGAVDVYSDDFENTRLSAAEKAAIIDVMENYEGYIGSGSVVDVLFLTSIYYNGSSDDFATRQPQIVPIFGTFYVENGLVD